MSTKRKATAEEIGQAQDLFKWPRAAKISETPRKTYFDNFVVISFCTLCLAALAAFIQYG